jgi:hypothetical protein
MLLELMSCFSDFPGGEGESKCVGRGSVEIVKSAEGKRMLGFEKFEGLPTSQRESKEFVDEVNHILGL